MLQRAARNAYSWWWASHIRTKQSKWLDQNLQDMEEKVEYILKIINQDGDSFAVRAEMYYRKRPELVNYVEDCFRGYRALAERYDSLSRDLQSANRTIAAVYPERVQLSMDEEEEEISFHAALSAPFQNTNLGNSPTSLPAAPKVNPPKSPNFHRKKSKKPSRLVSKKGLVKIGGEEERVVARSSGLSKTEALEEIDKLQKGILTLQTEKEFTKSSYENRLARFWEIENGVTEMQAKVSDLQDEFGIGRVIEDDEARTLMATAALKSCQETLAKLQEKQAQTNEEARIEYQRIHKAQEKFESIKEGHFSSTSMNEQENSGERKLEIESQYLKDLHEEAESVKLKMAKVKEDLLLGEAPLTVSELAEKIDELVDKVISLETDVISQTSLVTRLRSETNELYFHLRSLEEDKEILIEGSNKSSKIRQLEEELRRVQNFNQNVEVQNQTLQTHFQVASSNIDQLSENLLDVKPDEEVQNTDFFEEAGVRPGENLFQHTTAADKNGENYVQLKKQTGFFDVVVEVSQLKAASKAEEESTIQPFERALGEELSKKGPVKDVLEDGQEENIVKPYLSTYHEDALKDASEDNSEKGLRKCEDKLTLDFDLNSMISKEGRTEEEVKKGDLQNCNHLGKAEECNFVEPYQSIQHEDFSNKGIVKDVSEDKPEKGFTKPEEDMALYNSMISEGRMEAEAKKDDVLSYNPFVSVEEDNTAGPYQSIQHETLLKKGLVKDVSQDKREEGFKVVEDPKLKSSSTNAAESWYVSHPSNPFDDNYGIMGSWNNGIIGERKENQFPDSAPTKAQVSCQLDQPSEKGQQVKGRAEDESSESLKQEDKDMEELDTDEDEPNWRHLFMYGLEDREKMLLEEYTATLRNYKEVRKKLSEVEKRNRASLFKTTVQMKVLKNSNASKDAEIQSLHQKLNLFQTNIDETQDLSTLEKEEEKEGEIKKEEEDEEGEIEKISIDEAPNVSSIEEKLRMDIIDDLLEENIDFWLRFSTALHQIQKFQTAFHDLETELKGVKEKKQDGNLTKQDQSEIRPIYKHLRDIITEMTLWWENTEVLKGDLDHRLSSLSSILEEISRLSNYGGETEMEEQIELTDYQAAKFQGEVMNMKQENTKVADELRAGADRVKRLQIDIEKTLAKLDEELGKSQQTKSSSSRSKIPLRSFLFGVKLKKQKPSLFACMSPALQKQYSDLSAWP